MKEGGLRWSYSSLEITSGKIHQDLDQLISRKSDRGRHGPGPQWRRRGVGDALVLLVQCLSATFAADANFRPAQPKWEGLPKKAQGWMRNLPTTNLIVFYALCASGIISSRSHELLWTLGPTMFSHFCWTRDFKSIQKPYYLIVDSSGKVHGGAEGSRAQLASGRCVSLPVAGSMDDSRPTSFMGNNPRSLLENV
ncbi:hypothetical protein K438DRAFT_1770175 [Mycena galopus ATCC 62051]|nr:hypothetical protein K438DRAFT_1770175 [Mycena galopus ATCC 62051]